MLNFIIKTYRVGTIYSKPHLFLLNKEMNGGKPQKKSHLRTVLLSFFKTKKIAKAYFSLHIVYGKQNSGINI
jgi:hypothetical protein